MAPDGNRYDQLVNDRINELSQQLQAHITDCSAQSRRLFWAVVAVLGWLVVHSLPFVSKLTTG